MGGSFDAPPAAGLGLEVMLLAPPHALEADVYLSFLAYSRAHNHNTWPGGRVASPHADRLRTQAASGARCRLAWHSFVTQPGN